jgi:hypothetical protein
MKGVTLLRDDLDNILQRFYDGMRSAIMKEWTTG